MNWKFLALMIAVPACTVCADEKPAEAAKPAPLPEAAPAAATNPAAGTSKAPATTETAPKAEPLPSLLPDQILPPPVPRPQPQALRPARSGSTLRPPTTALDLELRIRYSKARAIAESDPKVRAAWDRSRAAATDYEKRTALKSYYDALFRRMLAIDRGIAPLVDGRRRDQTGSLEQMQIAPTVPQR
jgi:hypothetical protein